MRDYVRVFDRVARARFPGSTREAFRLLARGEVEVFADSTLGKVTFSLLRDPGATLLRYPDIFKVVVRGPDITAHRVEDRRVAVTHPRYYGSIEHGLGLVEGLVQSFDKEPRVEVTVEPDRRVDVATSAGRPDGANSFERDRERESAEAPHFAAREVGSAACFRGKSLSPCSSRATTARPERRAQRSPLAAARHHRVPAHGVPLFVGREKSIDALDAAMAQRQGHLPRRAEGGQDQRARRRRTSTRSARSARSSSSCACRTGPVKVLVEGEAARAIKRSSTTRSTSWSRSRRSPRRSRRAPRSRR